jgi:small GTP-binding protein
LAAALLVSENKALLTVSRREMLIEGPGKSSLTVQFVDGVFVESYYPTIENTFSKVIKYKGQEYATEIIDTAGQVRKDIFQL